MEQLQAGTVDVAKLSIGTLSGLYEDTQVFLLPFLFKNNTEMWKVLEGDVGTTIKNGLNDYSIQGIGFTDCGSRCFYTTTEVKTIDDVRVILAALTYTGLQCAVHFVCSYVYRVST